MSVNRGPRYTCLVKEAPLLHLRESAGLWLEEMDNFI